MSWLTEATSPWWSAPVATLVTLAVGNYFTNRSTDKERAATSAQNAAAHKNAQTLAEMQHAADLAKQEAALAQTSAEEERRLAIELGTAALTALAALRSALAASASLNNAGQTDYKPVPPAVLTEFVAKVTTASVSLNFSRLLAYQAIEQAKDYMTGYSPTLAASRPADIFKIDETLEMLGDRIIDSIASVD